MLRQTAKLRSPSTYRRSAKVERMPWSAARPLAGLAALDQGNSVAWEANPASTGFSSM